MKNLKSKIFAGVLGTGLFFGAANKIFAQREIDVSIYNNDQDDFPEELMGYDLKQPDKEGNTARYTSIYYSDKNGDNFYENIRVLNCDEKDEKAVLNVEDFYVNKNNGLIDFNYKTCYISKEEYLKNYPDKDLRDIMKENYENLNCQNRYSSQNLTKEMIYSLFPEVWGFYGGFGERVKKIINASKDQTELKNLVSNERYLWRISDK